MPHDIGFIYESYFSFQLLRPGVLFFIDISTTANEMKAGLQTATVNSLSPSCVGFFFAVEAHVRYI